VANYWGPTPLLFLHLDLARHVWRNRRLFLFMGHFNWSSDICGTRTNGFIKKKRLLDVAFICPTILVGIYFWRDIVSYPGMAFAGLLPVLGIWVVVRDSLDTWDS
jgi:hypothetical protein